SFFFQAEDGIRDFHVTGVQTCALPISENRFIDFLINKSNQKLMFMKNLKGSLVFQRDKINPFLLPFRYDVDESIWMLPTSNKYRSEERRVGKECRPSCST